MPTATPIAARAGEKLLLVAPFVGYTSDDLRFNVAGRIQEALTAEIEESKLQDARAVIWPDPLMAQEQARQALVSAQAAAVIWGEYDAGRVRANVTISGAEVAQWVNPVDSPADLRLAINEAVPHAARIFALFALGQLYRDAGQDAQALEVFQKALQLQPEDDTTAAALHFYAGTLLPRVQGNSVAVLTQSIDHFTQVLASKPAWENALYNRGTAYLGRALLSPQEGPDLDAAIADLSAVVDRQPHRFDPLLNRGIAFYQRHSAADLDAAIADFTRAAEARPQDYRAYFHRALALIRAGDKDRWEADLEQARTLNPTYAPILNAFCWGYGLTGQPQAGLTYCEQAVSADPTGSSYDSRAIVYAQLDRYAEAATDLERYLAWVKQAYPDLYEKYRGPEAEAWIAALREGRNPFTSDVLARLRGG